MYRLLASVLGIGGRGSVICQRSLLSLTATHMGIAFHDEFGLRGYRKKKQHIAMLKMSMLAWKILAR